MFDWESSGSLSSMSSSGPDVELEWPSSVRICVVCVFVWNQIEIIYNKRKLFSFTFFSLSGFVWTNGSITTLPIFLRSTNFPSALLTWNLFKVSTRNVSFSFCKIYTSSNEYTESTTGFIFPSLYRRKILCIMSDK